MDVQVNGYVKLSYYTNSTHLATFFKFVFLLTNAILKSHCLKVFLPCFYSLDEKKGLDVGKTYRNSKACSLFVKYIAKAERDQLTKTIEEAKFCSVMVDGSTDRSVKEEELIYVRVCKEGKVRKAKKQTNKNKVEHHIMCMSLKYVSVE